MRDSKLFKNSTFSVLQTIAMAMAALLLFKMMVLQEGLKITGLWSFLSSITTVTGFGSFGFANSLLFYIPKYQMEHNESKVFALVNTSLLSVLGCTIILCGLSLIIFSFILPHIIEKDQLETANRLLPLVIVSLFFSALSTTYLSVLDGLMLMHIRAKINIIGSAIFLVSGFVLLRQFGIIGIPIAQLIQNIFLLITPYFFVKKRLPGYHFLFSFDTTVFKDIFKYGFNFQLISLTQIVSEPFMKAMITKFGGSHITAIFDFCVKLLSVFRSLIISANQTIVPQLTIFKTQGKIDRIATYYKANFTIVSFFSLIFFLAPVALTDALSMMFLNETNSNFDFILLQVSLGLLTNAIAFPAYFHYLGTGQLKWNVLNNTITALLIFISSPVVGILVGGKYMVMCWSLSAMTGSILLIAAFSKEYNISGAGFFNKSILQVLVALLLAVFINKFINSFEVFNRSVLLMFTCNAVVLCLLLLYPVWKMPLVQKARSKMNLNKRSS